MRPVSITPEIWRGVPSTPSIMASSWGRIWMKPHYGNSNSKNAQRMYKPAPTFGVTRSSKKGANHSYKATHFRSIGNIKIHRAVCEAFHGPAPFPRAVVIHINEDAYDNRPENLKWGTQKENLNGPRFIAYCKSRVGAHSPYYKANPHLLDKRSS